MFKDAFASNKPLAQRIKHFWAPPEWQPVNETSTSPINRPQNQTQSWSSNTGFYTTLKLNCFLVVYNPPMKKLLVIGYVWPEPNSSAAGARMLQLLDSFAQQGYAITYASPAQASPHAVDLAELNIDAVEIELNNQSFDEFIQTLEPNAVLFDRFMMEEQFAWRVEKHCPNALRILDTEDLHCLRISGHIWVFKFSTASQLGSWRKLPMLTKWSRCANGVSFTAKFLSMKGM